VPKLDRSGASSREATINISLAIFLFTSLTITGNFVKAADIAGGQDHPLISRYEGSERISKKPDSKHGV
jgi:hypothetical protein